MNIEEIRREIEELSILASSWVEGNEPALIERDIVLSKLSRLYEGVRFLTATIAEVDRPVEDVVVKESVVPTESVVEQVAEEVEEVEVEPQMTNESAFAFDVDAVSLVVSEPEPVAVVEPIIEVLPVVEIEPEPEPEVEPESEVEAEPKSSNMLFDIDPLPKNRRRRSVLMSLYDDDLSASKTSTEPTPQSVKSVEPAAEVEDKAEKLLSEPEISPEKEASAPDSSLGSISIGSFVASAPMQMPTPIPVPEPAPIPTPAPIPAPMPILADTLAADVETVADRLSISAPRTIFSDYIHYRSFDELGINERYLLARDLFGDDPQLCRDMLEKIGAFDNYDDAMIFIAENFNWAPELDGAKLLLSVLENKFNIS